MVKVSWKCRNRWSGGLLMVVVQSWYPAGHGSQGDAAGNGGVVIELVEESCGTAQKLEMIPSERDRW